MQFTSFFVCVNYLHRGQRTQAVNTVLLYERNLGIVEKRKK